MYFFIGSCRSADDMQMYHPECVPVTHDTIQGAVDWLWELDRLASVSKTATAEAVLKAMTDQHVSWMISHLLEKTYILISVIQKTNNHKLAGYMLLLVLNYYFLVL